MCDLDCSPLNLIEGEGDLVVGGASVPSSLPRCMVASPDGNDEEIHERQRPPRTARAYVGCAFSPTPMPPPAEKPMA